MVASAVLGFLMFLLTHRVNPRWVYKHLLFGLHKIYVLQGTDEHRDREATLA